mmetsp:Transcript_28884/g.69874  ORF Transcript_28884/g.69874 Transcript_28884/m.69874 type:complete len:200 (-) Transcript_28884:144-743(-)
MGVDELATRVSCGSFFFGRGSLEFGTKVLAVLVLLFGALLSLWGVLAFDLISLVGGVIFLGVGLVGCKGAFGQDVAGLRSFSAAVAVLAILEMVVATYAAVITYALAHAAGNQHCSGLRHPDECQQWFRSQYLYGIVEVYVAAVVVIAFLGAWTLVVVGNYVAIVEAGGDGREMLSAEQYRKLHGDAAAPLVGEPSVAP